MEIEIHVVHYLVISTVMLFCGIYGFFTRKNLLALLISVELMLNATNINFAVFNRYLFPGQLEGHFFSLFGIAIAAAIEGVRPFLIETQALVSTAAYGTPQRSATGFDLRRLNMLLAVLEKRVGFKLAQKDVFLNIAGGIRVTDPAIDLSVIASVLSSNVDTAIERNVCMAGEVGLSGEIRPVTRIGQRVAEAAKLGFTRILIPEGNVKGLDTRQPGIEIVPVSRVEAALRELFA